ncbi:hypothetical protein D5085_11720 [Ectothiorhodospiraceae bacterium BW-2]|nr:hypothetical protein D5085_11720 [Ectothiorhodospiraceae bacterium BW-2]
MSEQLKQRLVGAVVLLSLAVIFIPMLLGGREATTQITSLEPHPPKPVFSYESLPLPTPDQLVFNDETVVTAPEPSYEPEPNKTPEPSSPPSHDPKPTVAQPVTEPPVETEVPPVSDNALAWVVQIASVTRQQGALALRDKVREQGHRCFVLTTDINGTRFFRVRVGPFLDKSEAQRAERQLQQQLKLKGQILRHASQ